MQINDNMFSKYKQVLAGAKLAGGANRVPSELTGARLMCNIRTSEDWMPRAEGGRSDRDIV